MPFDRRLYPFFCTRKPVAKTADRFSCNSGGYSELRFGGKTQKIVVFYIFELVEKSKLNQFLIYITGW